jgi:hypothetical protein
MPLLFYFSTAGAASNRAGRRAIGSLPGEGGIAEVTVFGGLTVDRPLQVQTGR